MQQSTTELPAMRLSLSVGLVLYRTAVSEISSLIDDLLSQGATHVYIVDNSPPSFPTFTGWNPPAAVTVIRTGKNLGYGRAHNLAFRQSVRLHEYHLICNPDIELRPNTLATLHSVMSANSDVGVVMPRIVGPDGSVHYLCKRAPLPLDYLSLLIPATRWAAKRRWRFQMRDCSYDQAMEVECLSGCFMFFRSSVLEALGGFDEQYFLYFEDFDLSRRARMVARNLFWPHAEVVHQYQRGHQRSLRLLFAFVRSAVQYFNKWGWIPRADSR